MSDDRRILYLEMIQQILKILGHTLNGWWRSVTDIMPSVATRVPPIYAMSLVEKWQEREPFLMTGRPAVQHNERRTFAGNLEMNFRAIIGKEVRHGVRSSQ